MRIFINLLLGIFIAAWVEASDDSLIDKMMNSVDNKDSDLLSISGVEDLQLNNKETDSSRDEDFWEINENTVKGRAFNKLSQKIFTTVKSGAKMVGKVRKKLAGKLKKMVGKFKKSLNQATKRGKDGWNKFKKMAKDPQAGKKMFKKVVNEVLNTGKEEALEYLQAALLEWVQEKIHNELCECSENKPINGEKSNKRKMNQPKIKKCVCCINPLGLEKSCVKIIAKPEDKSFDVTLTFDGTEFLRTDLVIPKEMQKRSVCSVPKEIGHERMDVCTQLPNQLHFITVCISPGNVELGVEDDGEEYGYAACFQIKIGKFNLSFEKCLDYDYERREISFSDYGNEE